MRRLILFATLAIPGLLLLAGSAAGAPAGSIVGQVVNGTTGVPQPGVKLTLTSGTESGESEVVATLRTDAKGRYRFEDLVTGDDRFYALDARFEGGLFAGRPVTLPSDTSRPPVIDSTLRVWDTTTEPGVIAITRNDMFVVANSEGAGVIESVTITNTSDTAYIGRGREMLGNDAAGASFAFALPSGAVGFNIFDSTLDIPELVTVDNRVAATIAIPPGENRATFSYQVPGTGGSFDLSRPALYPTLEMSLYAAAPLEVRSNRLVPKEGVELEGRTYERWSTEEPLDAGDALQAIAVAQASLSLWPVLGAGAGVVSIVAAVAWAMSRRRKTARPADGPVDVPVETTDREQLLEQVAVLDLALEAGEIDHKSWDDERSRLIGRLRGSQGQLQGNER